MKPNPGETYELWAERVRLFEQGYALQQLAKGEPIAEVLSRMAYRIQQKMMHPIIQGSKNLARENSTHDLEKIKKGYFENYIKNISPRADQVDGTFFDNNE